ncbi:hypothetical protein B0D71_18115 [Pseudomonas laurylsulfativorans]|uniref:SOS response-associated peptidase n=2 Tax=Pseudomonas TaxID=286 RepID=A0A2S3VMX6_9PSED|nr:hypothetical protein B0D71_18115 [Pseudomonas laurylsulfativorans]PPK37472.1 hypothetical protein CD175_20945 [Pseudomonas laurylsulfatiphila]
MQPYLIRYRERTPVLCAAICQYPIAEHEAGEHDGFVIITGSVGGVMDIHDRRSVSLPGKLAQEWLSPATPKESAKQMVLLLDESPEAFEWFKIDRAIGNVRNQGRALIKLTGQIQCGDYKGNG